MSNRFKRKAGICLIVVMAFAVGVAQLTAFASSKRFIQSTCPVIVSQAFDDAAKQCTTFGRNKLCYGNKNVNASFQASASNVTFNAPGDVADVTQIKSITLGAMDTSANTWGVAEMKVQAELPNTDPNQVVTMILFGDVQLRDGVPDADGTAVALVTPVSGGNVAQTAAAATRQASQAAMTATKLAALVDTATAKASTATPTGTISVAKRIQAAATATRLANLINTATAAAPTLAPIASASPGTSYSAMQAFYFKSGDKTLCDQAPHDGLLIQTPQGSGRVSFVVDGVDITLGSTVFMQTINSNLLVIYVLEGLAGVRNIGAVTEYAGPGTFIEVPIDPVTLNVIIFSISPAQFYRTDAVRALPLQLLPDAITPAPGLLDSLPFSTWTAKAGPVPAALRSCILPRMTDVYLIAQDSPGDHIWMRRAPDSPEAPVSIQFNKAADGSYSGVSWESRGLPSDPFRQSDTVSMKRSSSTHIDGQETIDNRQYGGPNCLATIPFTLDQTNAPPSPLGPTETPINQ